MDTQTIEFLVLRKTAYSETSWILAGLSPEVGRVSFLARGARRLDKRHFPEVDVFRCLRVTYRPARNSLHRWQTAETVADFATVAKSAGAFLLASELAGFALRYSQEALPCPTFYIAVKVALTRLAEATKTGSVDTRLAAACRTGVRLAMLDENGELDRTAMSDDEQRRLSRLLEMAAGNQPPPLLSKTTWQALEHWTTALLHAADYEIPRNPS